VGGKVMMKNDGGSDLIKVHGRHIWKCHNEPSSIPLIQANKNVKEKVCTNSSLPKEGPRIMTD
jgi:hypothetical protein